MRERPAGGRWWWLVLLVAPIGFASMWVWVAVAGAGPTREGATLHDLQGRVVGRVILSTDPAGGTQVSFSVGGLPPGFHAFQLYTNGVCDPQTGFTSVGDHYDHLRRVQPFDGDMPVILVGADGTGSGSFVTDRFAADVVEGMALVVHALPDNYANVPIGGHKDEYLPNGSQIGRAHV